MGKKILHNFTIHVFNNKATEFYNNLNGILLRFFIKGYTTRITIITKPIVNNWVLVHGCSSKNSTSSRVLKAILCGTYWSLFVVIWNPLFKIILSTDWSNMWHPVVRGCRTWKHNEVLAPGGAMQSLLSEQMSHGFMMTLHVTFDRNATMTSVATIPASRKEHRDSCRNANVRG